jgi:hypothetical protein
LVEQTYVSPSIPPLRGILSRWRQAVQGGRRIENDASFILHLSSPRYHCPVAGRGLESRMATRKGMPGRE